MLQTYEQKSRLKLVTTVIAILVVAGVILLADHLKSDDTVASTTSTTSSVTSSASNNTVTSNTTTNSSTTNGTATDGTYSATSSYSVPHGREDIQVSLTVKGGVITDASVQNSENDFDSAQYQEEFTAAYKTKVIGKKISGLQISTVAGASDTTQGFNEALHKIASKAGA